MNQYIITEEELDANLYDRPGLCKRIRSRPYKNEREKVLDELWDWASPEFNELDGDGQLHKGVCISPSGRLLQKIEKMRQVKV
jgi:hypothetical protein